MRRGLPGATLTVLPGEAGNVLRCGRGRIKLPPDAGTTKLPPPPAVVVVLGVPGAETRKLTGVVATRWRGVVVATR